MRTDTDETTGVAQRIHGVLNRFSPDRQTIACSTSCSNIISNRAPKTRGNRVNRRLVQFRRKRNELRRRIAANVSFAVLSDTFLPNRSIRDDGLAACPPRRRR